MIPYFEAHIAMEPKHRPLADALARDNGWWTSAIKGDDVLGPDVKVYMTCRGADAAELTIKTKVMCSLLGHGVWLRRKVEVAIFDEKNPVHEPQPR